MPAGWPVLAGTAENSRSWKAFAGAEGSTLGYGTPETGDSALSLGCARATRETTLVLRHEPVGAEAGMRLDMELLSEDSGSAVLRASDIACSWTAFSSSRPRPR